MKKLYALVFLGILISLQAHAQSGAEKIRSFDQAIVVNKDASLNVTEKIIYDFAGSQRHGIYRDIPYKYQRNGINYNLRISDISVPGQKFTTSNQGHNFEIKIGDPNITVAGVVSYTISYKVTGAINFFTDHDELYWNVVGDSWNVPIQTATSEITLPDQVSQSQIQIQCFTGTIGQTQSCTFATTAAAGASFSQTALIPSQAFTIVVGWPKGIVAAPTGWQKLRYTIEDNLIFLLPIFVLFFMLWLWNKYGRDPKPSIPIVALYEAPDGLNPAEVRYLYTEKTGNVQISSEIIYLATLGYLRIERIPQQGWFHPEDFKFTRLKKGDDLNNPFDAAVLDKLFLGSEEVLLSEVKKRHNRDLFDLNSIPKKLTKDGYFDKNPNTIRILYVLAPIGFGMILYFLSRFANVSYLISFGVSILIVLIVGRFMPRKTQKGADTKQLILGLRLYLSVAEKDRLDFHNDPEKDPKLFEKLLPYAMALDVSEQWSEKFEGLFEYHPSWYSDPANAYFNFMVFNSALGHFNTQFTTAMAAQTRTAAGGGSGFGGGGFSGGGFGGGGGGSW